MDITFGSSKVHTYIHYVDQNYFDLRRSDLGQACPTCTDGRVKKVRSDRHREEAEIKSRTRLRQGIGKLRSAPPAAILSC